MRQRNSERGCEPKKMRAKSERRVCRLAGTYLSVSHPCTSLIGAGVGRFFLIVIQSLDKRVWIALVEEAQQVLEVLLF